MSAPMSDEDRAYMQQQTGQSSISPKWQGRTHEDKVRTMLGWITLFTGIVAAATVANFIMGVIVGAAAASSSF